MCTAAAAERGGERAQQPVPNSEARAWLSGTERMECGVCVSTRQRRTRVVTPAGSLTARLSQGLGSWQTSCPGVLSRPQLPGKQDPPLGFSVTERGDAPRQEVQRGRG